MQRPERHAARTMQGRITIMHVLFRFSIGGLENGLVNLINGLDRARYRHVIVCLADYDATFLQRLEVADVEIHALHKRSGQDLRVWWRMWQLLRAVRPDILHTRNFVTLEYQLLAAVAGVRGRVHGEHGWDVQDLDGSKRKYRLARRVLGHCVQHFIALSKDLERYLLRDVGIAARKVVQIYNGVDQQRFASVPARAADAPLIIGSVGRMKAVKNQTLLCRAFIDLLARRAQLIGAVKLKLVGDGPLRSECAALVAAAGCDAEVEFVGDSARVAADLGSMDIFVLPSLAEGISNTILEAMASGLPVIATAVGGNPELVVDGVSGALVASDDCVGLSRALEVYIDDVALRHRHGAQGRALVEERYGLPRMLGDYDKVYRALAC